jgi:hypothetical protein
MSSSRRLAILCLAFVGGLGFLSLPGGSAAQTGHFAFADTTMLRDTLGLHFTHLFETADSLSREYGVELTPDSLRAHVIRYRLPIPRLLAMSDSMHVQVDSVGIYIDRERFNPLSANYATSGGQTSLKYRSTYSLPSQITTDWENGVDFTLQRGPMLLSNSTDITIERTNATSGLSLRQNQTSTSQANWRVSKNVSMGGVATLTGFNSTLPGGATDVQERTSNFQFSSRSKQQMARGVNSDVNLLAGYLNVTNSTQIKNGFSGDFNAHSRQERGDWFSHDFTAGVNGNLSRTRRPTSDITLGTHDLSAGLRGGLQLYQSAPVGLNLNYQARRTTVETPTEVDTVTRILTTNATVDATMRLRVDNNRYLNLIGNLGLSSTLQGDLHDKGWKAQARWVRGPWQLDADGGDAVRLGTRPRQNGGGGYDEDTDQRQASAQLERPFGRRFTTRLHGDIGLTQYRATATADSATPPTPRDSYRQSYRFETIYVPTELFNTKVALEVSLIRSINLPSTSTSNNTDTRSYRAEWNWSYRLMRGLTASQANSIQSDYEFFPFAPERNDLSLNYSAVTNLTAIVTPRLSIQLTHNALQQPHGDWRVLPDGSGVLLPADDNLNYTMSAQVTWSVTPGLSLNFLPSYLASNRTGTTNGVETPTRTGRRLTFSGGATLDVPLGKKGHLQGDVRRTFSDDRSTTYLNGVPQLTPLAQRDYWFGSLGFTWDL